MNKKIIAWISCLFLIFPQVIQASEATGTIDTGIDTGSQGVVVVAPTASPWGGSYSSSQSVTLTAQGASHISYQLGGTIPDCNSAQYSGAISITSSTILKAISCYQGGISSSVASFSYTISSGWWWGGGGWGGWWYYVSTKTTDDEELTLQSNTGGWGGGFDDTQNHWSKEYVEFLQGKGIVWGVGDSNDFLPDNNIFRAEILKMSLVAAGHSIEELTTTQKAELINVFNDVDSVNIEEWWAKYVYYAYYNTDVRGYEDKTFRPGQEINRAEALKIILVVFGIDLNDVEDFDIPFVDVNPVQWFWSYVRYANIKQLVSGYEEDWKKYFKPASSITRAETAKIIYYLLQ